MACPAIRPHFFCLAKRNGVEPPKKSAFEASTSPWWARPPLPFGRKPQRDELARQVGLYTVGKLAGQSQLDAVGCDGGALSPWERRAGPNTSRGGTLKRVSLGLHPVSLRKSKEMGWNGQYRPQTTSQEIGAHVPALLPKVGRETSRLPTGSAHANGGATGAKKRFSLAARHRFFWQDKRNGVEWQGKVTKTSQRNGAHAHSDEKKRGNPRRGFPLGLHHL